jgi:hypothetical protein
LSHKTRHFQPVFVARTNPPFSGKAASFSEGHEWLCQWLGHRLLDSQARVGRSTISVADLVCTCFT